MLNKMTETRYGSMLYNKNDIIIGRNLEEYGEFSQKELDFLAPYIPKGGICVDIGANIGTHVLFFAQAVGPQGKVIAFEPQEVVFQLLCANVALNHHLNVSAHRAAVGAVNATLRLPSVNYEKRSNFGEVSIDYNVGEPVLSYRLDHFCFTRLDLIKIDVEGYEPEVLLGAAQTLEMLKPLIYAEYHPEHHSQALLPILDKMGYDVYLHRPECFNVDNFKKNRTNWQSDCRERNIFCVPKARGLVVDLPKLTFGIAY